MSARPGSEAARIRVKSTEIEAPLARLTASRLIGTRAVHLTTRVVHRGKTRGALDRPARCPRGSQDAYGRVSSSDNGLVWGKVGDDLLFSCRPRSAAIHTAKPAVFKCVETSFRPHHTIAFPTLRVHIGSKLRTKEPMTVLSIQIGSPASSSDVDIASKLAVPKLLIITFGLVLHPLVIGSLIYGSHDTVTNMLRSGYSIPIFLSFFTALVASWVVLSLLLFRSVSWYFPNAMQLKTAGSCLTIVARSDKFTEDASRITDFSIEHALRWDARGWGGSQLLVWRGHALVILATRGPVVLRYAFPLFNFPISNQEILAHLNRWLAASKTYPT